MAIPCEAAGVVAMVPTTKVADALKKEWMAAWVAEQRRRGDYEKKLQSNEAWWPAALAVMNDAMAQNEALTKVIGLRLKLEMEQAEGFGDLALGDRKGPLDPKAPKSPEAPQDLAPGKILSQLQTEHAAEAIRRSRIASSCRDTLLTERLEVG
jgi:hypothetical protein